MSKFKANLVKDAKGIKEQRASIIENSARKAQENLVRTLTDELDLLNEKLLNLEDMSPDNTYSLRPTGKDFDPRRWVNELQNTKIAILNKEIEITVAKTTMTEWFVDEPKAKGKKATAEVEE